MDGKDLVCLEDSLQQVHPIKKFQSAFNEIREIGFNLSAYDESIFEYSSIEGQLRAIANCVTTISKDARDYIPSILLTLDFFTSSKAVADANQTIQGVQYLDRDTATKAISIKYLTERNSHILQFTPANNILLIDGPLFAGEATHMNFNLIQSLLEQNIIPIFLVKNSSSSRIVEQHDLPYNNDLHWAYSNLRPQHQADSASRSSLMQYTSGGHGKSQRTRVYAYLKPAYHLSPVRIEMSADTLLHVQETVTVDKLFEVLMHQFVLQGLGRNNQARLIAIAEKYARASLKSTHVYQLAEQTGLVSTMNEARGFH